MDKTKKRNASFDFIRIIACALVLFNHQEGYLIYTYNGTKPISWLYLFVSAVTKMNVPLFFLVSGSLLLEREESLRTIFRKRVSRILIDLALFNTILYLMRQIPRGTAAWNIYLPGLLNGKVEISYWYLYCYLGFLLMLPFIRAAAGIMNRRSAEYLVMLHFLIYTLVPAVSFLLGFAGITSDFFLESHFQIPFAAERCFFYPLIGYYLTGAADIGSWPRKKILRIALLAAAGIFLTSLLTFVQGNYAGGYTQDYIALTDYVTACAFFILVRRYFLRRVKNRAASGKSARRFARLITAVGPLTFGMYLFDPVWNTWFGELFRGAVSGIYPKILQSVLWCLLSMGLSGMAVFFLKKIPLAGKLF